MTQFSDYLALGSVPLQRRVWDENQNGPKNAFGVSGLGRGYLQELVPAAIAALATTANIAAAGNITLAANGSSVVGTTHPNGSSIYLLDCERALSIVSTADLTGVTFVATGYDNYGRALTATALGATGGTGSNTSNFLKTMRAVQSISVSGTANPVTAQTADVFGLNLALNDRGYLTSAYFNGATVETVTTADQTSPATGSTGSVRGKMTPGTAGTANGTRKLIVQMFASEAQIGPNATATSIYGVTQV